MRSLLLATSLLAAGCIGVISSSEEGQKNEPTATSAGACTAIVSPAPLRRLTREQFDRTVRDLLFVDTAAATAFADDDVIAGFEVGGNVSPLLAEQHVAAAESLAAKVDSAKIVPCTTGDCADRFIATFGRRAYRRPLTGDEATRLRALFDQGPTFNDGVRLVVEAVLLSPRFHYLQDVPARPASAGETVEVEDHAMASRLSYFLWGSMPDDALLDAADRGEVHTVEQIAKQAERLVADPRATAAITSFYRQWLHLDALDGMSRDDKQYPGWDYHTRADYRKSIEAFTLEATLSGPGGLSTLLEGSHLHVNEALAKILEIPGVVGDKMVRVEANAEQRAGLITHPALLAINSKSVGSDPIHRGIFVRTQLLCQDLPPPPPDVDLDIEQPKAGLSTRARFAAHTKNEACASCHKLIDGIGFGLESYDALGRFRTHDQGIAVDASGEVVGSDDANGKFVGGVQLAKRLAKSSQVRRCVASKWTSFALARAVSEADRCGIDGLSKAFAESGGDIRALMVAITRLDAFRKMQVAK